MAQKIIFMGTPDFAVPILKSIHLSKHKILKVYTQPPKKKDRGQKINFSPIHKYSIKANLDVEYPDNLEIDKEINNIKNLNPDIIIVVAYGKILPSKLLNLKNSKFINIHASLLPKWRGAAPIQRAIMNLDKETGISIMKIVPKLDAGPVMMKSKVSLPFGISFNDLSIKMSNLASKMILDCIDLIEKKQDTYTPQVESKATYAKKIAKQEAKINWNDRAKNIIAKVNALHPNPGSWFEINGLRIKPIKLKEINIQGTPGRILDNNFTIGCSENSVQVLELKKEGKKPMHAKEYLKGNKIEIGTKLNV